MQRRKTPLSKGWLILIFSSHEDSQLKKPFAESKPTIGGIMETYILIVLVALFFGVMGIIAMLERRRRTELAQFEQLHQTLSACLGSLQAIHSSNETQMAQVAEALSQVRTSVESGTKSSSDVIHATSKELLSEAQRTTKAVLDLKASLEESINFDRRSETPETIQSSSSEP